MPWYHYSPLVHLPRVLAEGLHPHAAHPQVNARLAAIALTTQADPTRLAFWGDAMNARPEKTAVRYTCTLPANDSHLEPARAAWKRFKLGPGHVALLDPLNQGKWWAYYFGAIPVESLTIELRGRAGYVAVSGAELARVAAAVAGDRDKFDDTPPVTFSVVGTMRAHQPGYRDKWQTDLAFPADEFAVRPTV